MSASEQTAKAKEIADAEASKAKEIAPLIAEVPVHRAWQQVMAEVQAVGKDGHNKQQDYPFRGIDGVMNAAGPAMRHHGVIVMPSVIETTYRDVEVGHKRTLMREVTVRVRYTIIGPQGDVLTVANDPDFGVVVGESLDSGDKGTAKAMSVAYRTFLIQALTIPTHQPDPGGQSYERATATPAAPAQPPIAAALMARFDALDAEYQAKVLQRLAVAGGLDALDREGLASWPASWSGPVERTIGAAETAAAEAGSPTETDAESAA